VRYGLDKKTEQLYPFELSGGMARRILIATALMEDPKLVIADEPTPGLHTDAAKQVLGHFREIADDGAGVLLITHDLELALEVADRVVVFYAGTTVEEALVSDFKEVSGLRHPYTKALWQAMPEHGFHSIEGSQPYAGKMPSGCPFAPRCTLADHTCMSEIPWKPLKNGHVRCVHTDREGGRLNGA
jgi:peptide/nickel transport system ATP-binding protein